MSIHPVYSGVNTWEQNGGHALLISDYYIVQASTICKQKLWYCISIRSSPLIIKYFILICCKINMGRVDERSTVIATCISYSKVVLYSGINLNPQKHLITQEWNTTSA